MKSHSRRRTGIFIWSVPDNLQSLCQLIKMPVQMSSQWKRWGPNFHKTWCLHMYLNHLYFAVFPITYEVYCDFSMYVLYVAAELAKQMWYYCWSLCINVYSSLLCFCDVQSDTEFWDKMQAEWEELARRNWLTENEQGQIPPSVSPHEKVSVLMSAAWRGIP